MRFKKINKYILCNNDKSIKSSWLNRDGTKNQVPNESRLKYI